MWRPAASASCGSLLEIQNLWLPHTHGVRIYMLTRSPCDFTHIKVWDADLKNITITMPWAQMWAKLTSSSEFCEQNCPPQGRALWETGLCRGWAVWAVCFYSYSSAVWQQARPVVSRFLNYKTRIKNTAAKKLVWSFNAITVTRSTGEKY